MPTSTLPSGRFEDNAAEVRFFHPFHALVHTTDHIGEQLFNAVRQAIAIATSVRITPLMSVVGYELDFSEAIGPEYSGFETDANSSCSCAAALVVHDCRPMTTL